MIKITEENLALIQEYAALFIVPTEIAIMIGVDEDTFIEELSDKESMIYKAYFKGKISAKIEHRKNTIKMAKHGSPQAEDLVIKFQRLQEGAENA